MTKTEQYIIERLDNLERAFLQAQRNAVDVTEKADKTVIIEDRLEEITPYIDTKRAYIGDSSVTFENVQGDHVNAYCELDGGTSISTTIERSGNTVKVLFDTLDEVATVTISVM